MINLESYTDTSNVSLNDYPFAYDVNKRRDQQAQGTVHSAFTALRGLTREPGILNAIKRRVFEPQVYNEFTDFFWHPTRIVNGLMEATQGQLEGQKRIQLVNEATRFALHTYAEGPTYPYLKDLMNVVEDYGLMDVPLAREIDPTSAGALYPNRTQNTARRLSEKTGSSPLFIVPLCNGGLAHGLTTALEYKRFNPEVDARIYPALFSARKSAHKVPQLSSAENEYILEGSKDRTLVVLDDDSYTGLTISGMVSHLRQSGAENVIGIAVHDVRDERACPAEGDYIGQWWENPRGR